MHMLQRVGGDWSIASWALGFCWATAAMYVFTLTWLGAHSGMGLAVLCGGEQRAWLGRIQPAGSRGPAEPTYGDHVPVAKVAGL